MRTIADLATTASDVAVLAHGVQGRADTPVPLWLFIVTAAVVVAVSFLGIGLAWSSPRWASIGWRPARRLSRVLLDDVVVSVLRIGVLGGLFAVIGAALVGSTLLNSNIAPVTVFVVWWIGLVPVSLLLGNVWRELNPWATLARLLGARSDTGRYPAEAGLWPAAVLIGVWAWLELVYPLAAAVRLLGWVIVAYTVLTVAAMFRYGVDTWLDRGEAFAVYTGMLASLSPVETRVVDGRRVLGFRAPVIGSTAIRARPGLVGFVSVLVGSVTFDGLSGTDFWTARDKAATGKFVALGLDDFPAGIIVATIGLLVMTALSAAAFRLACVAADRVAGFSADGARTGAVGAFAHSLVPIAAGYHVAHYFTLFVFQAQDLKRLISDPLGRGADYFGTAYHRIDFTAVSPNTIWTVQIAAIVIAHVLGIALAHNRALQLAQRPHRVARSQYAMLVLMVALTTGGLWFLSEGMTPAGV